MTEVNGPLVTIMHPGWPRAVTGNPPAGTTGNIAIAVSPPANPQPGWLWWSTIDGQLYVFTGCEWVAASCCEQGISVAPEPPTFPSTGVLWWNTNDGQLYVWDGSEWVAASCCGPQTITSIRSTVPENPNTGDLWWNSNDGQLYVWIGTAWVPTSCCGGLPDIPNNTVLGNMGGGPAEPRPLTQPQLTALVNTFTQTLNGSVPAPGAATPPTDILQADGTWVDPGGLAPIPNDTVLGNISGGTAVPGPLTPAALTPLINLFTATRSGTVPPTGTVTNVAPTNAYLDSSAHWTVPGTNFRSVASSYTAAATDDAVYVGGVASPTITLPALSAVPSGKQIRVISQATTSLIVAQTGTDPIFTLTDSGWISSTTALTLTPSTTELLFLAVGTVGWFMVTQGEPLSVNNGTSTFTAIGKVDASGLASTAVFTATSDGLVPAPGAATPTNFVLGANGSWNNPLPTLPANTVLGNPTAASAVATAVTQAQLTALINLFTQTLSGAVPAPGVAATISQYLRSDATWAMPGTNYAAGAGDPWSVPATTDVMLVQSDSQVYMPAPTPNGRVIRVINQNGTEVSFTTIPSGGANNFINSLAGWINVGPEFWTGVSSDVKMTELLFVAANGAWYVVNQGPTLNVSQATQNAPVTMIGKTSPPSANVRTFTASGTYTPSAGIRFAQVECIGGGGAGGGVTTGGGLITYAGGGGSGGYSRSMLSAASIGASQVVTIGQGGTGVAGGNGNAGSPTSFGTLVIALGGAPANVSNGSSVGAPGSGAGAGTAQLAFGGTAGLEGVYKTYGSSTTTAVLGGTGGAIWGGSQRGSSATNGNAFGGSNATPGSGAGGTGASNNLSTATNQLAGGNGASGICIVTEFIF